MLVDELGKLESEQVGTTNLDSGTPETALIAKTEAASLEAAIAGLPPAYRGTLVLRDVQGHRDANTPNEVINTNTCRFATYDGEQIATASVLGTPLWWKQRKNRWRKTKGTTSTAAAR